MAKDDLIGKGLWEAYSKKVQEKMNNPKYRGSFTQKDAEANKCKLIIADYGDASCGDAIQLFWLVDEKTNTIKDACFLSFGCGTAIASADTMADLTIGKTVDEATKITNLDVEKALRDDPKVPAFPGQKMHCSVMAYDVIKRAAAKYRGIDLKEIEKDEIVCECAQVSYADIVDAIVINDLKSVKEITEYTKAGGFCKSCIRPGGHEQRKYYLVDILKDTREKIDNGELIAGKKDVAEIIEGEAFVDQTPAKKIEIVNEIFNAYVRPVLAKDKGNVEVADVEKMNVKIIFKGACQGCVVGSGTQKFIEGILREKIDKDILVSLY